MNTTHVDYSLEIVGVFGRNRKAKFDSIRLMRVPKDEVQPTIEQLKTLFYSKIKEIKAKPGSKVSIKALPVEIQDGFASFLVSRVASKPLHAEVLER